MARSRTLGACRLALILAISFQGFVSAQVTDDVDSPTSTSDSSTMKPYLHFTTGQDTLWLEAWVPKTPGAIVGVCLGLFLLGIIERWISAMRGVAGISWRERTAVEPVHSHGDTKTERSKGLHPAPSLWKTTKDRFSSGFVLPNEVSRGFLQVVQSSLIFAFMLVVMTYQASFILSIIAGLGVGETLFGRYNAI